MRVLLVSHDLVCRRMAGPGIRCLHLARILAAAGHAVTLAAPGGSDLEGEPFPIVAIDDAALRRLAPRHDAVISQGWVYERHEHLRAGPWRVIVDLYDPFVLENLVLEAGLPMDERLERHRASLRVLNHQLRDGDFFLCAGERQRDHWLGALVALDRVNPRTAALDPSLRSLIDSVPFGIPDEPPQRRGHPLRGAHGGVEADALVVLWGGGLYDWLDPLTAVRGAALAARTVPGLRLVLFAGRHPNAAVPEMGVVAATRAEAERLGIAGDVVRFVDRWVEYEERAGWLLDADIGISTHLDHVETRLSYRTRVLDYLWAGLPVLCTEGDVLADLVEREALGRTVPPGDPEALAAALVALADPAERAACAARVAAVAPRLRWSVAAAPLLRHLGGAPGAADLAATGRGRGRPAVPGLDAPAPPPLPGVRPRGWLRRTAGRLR